MYAIIDIETTGGHPVKNRIIEVAVFIHNGHRVIEEFATLINPETYISPFISAFTGITNEMVEGAPLFGDIINELEEFTRGRVFVAHNARFDYSFFRNEFKRAGKRFQRQQLCTVKLARKILPGQKSYSLGKLCKNIGIPLDNRHRAFGDAAATAQLFDLLLKNDKKKIIEEAITGEIREGKIPPNLDPSILKELPEDTGVYYFHDERGKILYIGKSKNIRTRINTHLSGDLNSKKYHELKNRIHDISWELTGSQLAALLRESYEIKKFMPPFNFAQKRKKLRYGILKSINEQGFIIFTPRLYHPDRDFLKVFSTKYFAWQFMVRSAHENGLCLNLCGLDGSGFGCGSRGECVGGCPAEKGKDAYNEVAEKFEQKFRFTNESFFIIGEGRNPGEASVVAVEEGKFKGLGYLEESLNFNNPNDILDSLEKYEDNQDARIIIKSYLKNTRDKVIKYAPGESYFL